jgi:hypothetical protein
MLNEEAGENGPEGSILIQFSYLRNAKRARHEMITLIMMGFILTIYGFCQPCK